MSENKERKINNIDDSVKASLIKNPKLKKVFVTLFVCFLVIMFAGTCVIGVKPLAKDMLNAKTNGVEGTITNLEADFNDSLLAKKGYIDIYGGIAGVIDMRFIRDADYSNSVVKDNHGNLHFVNYGTDYTDLADDLAIYKSADIPILFVQPPTKYIEGYTEFPLSIEDETTATADELQKLLAENDIMTLDLREAACEELNPETMFFATDHHWTVETAFWALQKTVDYIESDIGIDLDPEGFYTDINNWNKETHENSFLGSQGRRVGSWYAGLDDFTLITPNFETEYSVLGLKDDEELTGSFQEVILDDELLDFTADTWINHYAGYWGKDDDKVVVDNLLNNNGANILLLKDSFGLPYGAFLSSMVDTMTIIDLRYYDINELQAYMAQNDFDMILVMYKMYSVASGAEVE